MSLRYPTRKSISCSKLWRFLILSQFVLNKKTNTMRKKLGIGSGIMYRYQFLFRYIWSKNLKPFAITIPIISSHPLLRLSNQLLKANLKWNWIFFKFTQVSSSDDKNAWFTVTTEPKKQPSWNGDRFCRWLYRWLWKINIYLPSS